MTRRGRALHGIPKVQLEDIEDIRQYVGGIIARRWGTLPFEQQDELALEAIAILYELHRNQWRPRDCRSFRVYCTEYLPRRLIDHWRKEMRRTSGYNKGDGSYETVTSLDALTADQLVPAEGRGRKKGIQRDKEAA